MKIVKVTLENYAGLVEGLGREHVEIDFTEFNKTDINKIMLLGRNGSGKSVIANALSPFAENFDNRDTVIVPGRNGRKEIIYETKDGTLIRCEHLWTKSGKVKSFMYINDNEEPVEETVKGNVTNFKNAVSEYLGVDADFMKIGKIGADINNFIDLKPTERKSFLSKFMPEVEEWAKMNKNASTRLTDIKREIRGLEVELDKLDDLEDINFRLQKISVAIENLQLEKEKLDFSRGEETNKLSNIKQQIQEVVNHIVNELSPLLPDINFIEIINESDNKIRDLEEIINTTKVEKETKISEIISALPVLEKYTNGTATDTLPERISTFKEDLVKTESSLEFLTQKYSDTLAEKEKITFDLNETSDEISKILKSKEILDKLEAELEEATNSLNELKVKYKDIPLEELDDTITFDQVKQAADNIRNLCDNVDDILNYFDSNDILNECISVNFDSSNITQLAKYNRTKAKELTETISKRQSRKGIAEAQVKYAKHMAVHKCNNTNCPHEKTIQEFLESSKQLENFDDDILKLRERIQHHEELDESYSKAVIGCSEVRQIYSQMRQSENILTKIDAWDYFVSFTNFVDLLKLSKVEINNILSVDYYFEALSAKREITNAEKLVDNLEDKIEKQNSSKEYYEYFTKKKEALEKSKEENAKLLDTINAKKNADQTNFDKLTKVISYCEILLDVLLARNNCDTGIEILNNWINKNSELVKTVDEINSKLSDIDDSYSLVTSELESNIEKQNDLVAKKNRREDFESRLSNLNDTIEKTQIIYNATHPTRGAPVNFIKAFLDNIRNIVNDLLDTALDGDMRIDFELNEKEFKIPVIKASGVVIPDVLQCSLGQISLVKTILSLSLVKNLYINSNTAYNIITLDEIDGPLDYEKNRQRFTNIIEKLCHELGIEQVFIISHNDNFFASELGLILFPGHCMPIDDPTFMSNKMVVGSLE